MKHPIEDRPEILEKIGLFIVLITIIEICIDNLTSKIFKESNSKKVNLIQKFLTFLSDKSKKDTFGRK